IAITALATLMNTALVAALFTLCGYVVGALASLSWFMLQLFSYGGIWMVETVPKPFQWLHPISPLTYVRDGYIAAFNGVGGFWPAVFKIIVIGLLALAAVVAAAEFQRKRYVAAQRAAGRSIDDDQTAPPADPDDTAELATVAD